jgi:hypothetical protein
MVHPGDTIAEGASTHPENKKRSDLRTSDVERADLGVLVNTSVKTILLV